MILSEICILEYHKSIQLTTQTYSLIITFCLAVMLSMTSFSQDKSMIDGPYLEYDGDSVFITWIDTGVLHKDIVHKDADYTFRQERLPSFTLQELVIEKDVEVEIENIEKYVALSDIHGQFDVFEKLMIAHEISDEEGEWIFGDGHLIIVGDMLDRGDKVLEVLWYLYHLEQKAKKQGGKVHVLLGNHEMMVMNGNVKYLHKKYRYTSGISGKEYSQYFGKSTFWGQWLASKNVIKSINNTIFLHGGLSLAMLKSQPNFILYNDIFRQKILHHSFAKLKEDKFLSLLTFQNGPLWYRGYAQPFAFDTKQADDILKLTEKERIVIGHTSMPKVMGLYGNRIVLVDSSMKFGKSGELLIYEDDKLYSGFMDGSKLPLISENKKKDKKPISDYLVEQESPIVSIEMPSAFRGVENIKTRAYVSTYFDQYGLDFSGDVFGKVPKKARKCRENILEIEISSNELSNYGFSSKGKIKLILPCNKNESELWIAEKLAELKNKDKGSYRLIRVILKDSENTVLDTKGILLSK